MFSHRDEFFSWASTFGEPSLSDIQITDDTELHYMQKQMHDYCLTLSSHPLTKRSETSTLESSGTKGFFALHRTTKITSGSAFEFHLHDTKDLSCCVFVSHCHAHKRS